VTGQLLRDLTADRAFYLERDRHILGSAGDHSVWRRSYPLVFEVL